MQFTTIVALTLAAAAVASPLPGGGDVNVGNVCSSGDVQCCNTVQTVNDASQSNALGGLLGLALGGLTGQVGINCSPISVLALVGGTKCSSNTVCCNGVNQNGLVNIGCNSGGLIGGIL